MNPELTDYLSKFRQRRRARRWWAAAVAACVAAGGAYGAVLGAAIVAAPQAAGAIELVAGVMAVLCGIAGLRFSFVFVAVNRTRTGNLSIAVLAAVFGAILGGMLAALILLALGALLGAIVGWILARAFLALRHNVLRRFLFGIAGAAPGTVAGAILWAVRLSPSAAPACAGRGLVIGAVAGPVLLLFVLGMWNTLARAVWEQQHKRRGPFD